MKDRGQLFGASSLIPPFCGFQKLNSGHQPCLEVPLPVELSCQHIVMIFNLQFLSMFVSSTLFPIDRSVLLQKEQISAGKWVEVTQFLGIRYLA